MTIIMTLLITFVILAILFYLFYRVKTPYYRIDKERIVRVLEMVLTGQATENDWQITFGMVIRHSPELEEIRQQCVDIEETEYIGEQKPPYLFSSQGLIEIEKILKQLTAIK